MSDFTPPPARSSSVVDRYGKPTTVLSGWFQSVWARLSVTEKGFTGTITTAKLTGLGANGSMTFQNGILVSQTPAT